MSWKATDCASIRPETALGIIFMLGGVVAAYVRSLQGRIDKQEAALVEYKLYVTERYASKE